MRNYWDLTRIINRLLDEKHILVFGSRMYNGVFRVYGVATNGSRLWAINDTCLQTTASDITDDWLYDITEGKTVYGEVPSADACEQSPVKND